MKKTKFNWKIILIGNWYDWFEIWKNDTQSVVYHSNLAHTCLDNWNVSLLFDSHSYRTSIFKNNYRYASIYRSKISSIAIFYGTNMNPTGSKTRIIRYLFKSICSFKRQASSNENNKKHPLTLAVRFDDFVVVCTSLLVVVQDWLVASSIQWQQESKSQLKYECRLCDVWCVFLWFSSLCDDFFFFPRLLSLLRLVLLLHHRIFLFFFLSSFLLIISTNLCSNRLIK